MTLKVGPSKGTFWLYSPRPFHSPAVTFPFHLSSLSLKQMLNRYKMILLLCLRSTSPSHIIAHYVSLTLIYPSTARLMRCLLPSIKCQRLANKLNPSDKETQVVPRSYYYYFPTARNVFRSAESSHEAGGGEEQGAKAASSTTHATNWTITWREGASARLVILLSGKQFDSGGVAILFHSLVT